MEKLEKTDPLSTRSRAPDVALALALLIWTGVQIARADAELNREPVVVGLHRTWRPPSLLPPGGPIGGALIDARVATLEDELHARYGSSSPPGPPNARGPGDGSAPRVLWPTADAPLLVVGSWGGDLVVFQPGLGVFVADPRSFGPDVPATILDVPAERFE